MDHATSLPRFRIGDAGWQLSIKNQAQLGVVLMMFTNFGFLAHYCAAFCAMLALSATAASAATINEFRRDHPGADTNEYFELAGTSGESLSGLSFIIIGDGAGGSGVLETIISLSGAVPSDGFFLAAMNTLGNGAIALRGGDPPSIDQDITSASDFENSDNVTALLVGGLTGTTGTDLDTDDDGTLDTTPWTNVIDAVGLIGDTTSPVHVYATQYGFTNAGPDGAFAPAHIYRVPDGSGSWLVGPFDGGEDTPGVTNLVPEPASVALMLVAGLGIVGCLRRRSIR
jgi:hypothetical protein